MLIIPTLPYSVTEMIQICQIRAATEGHQVSEDGFRALGSIAEATSLRYACQLLTPAKLVAETQGRTEILPEDFQEVDDLFLDAKASAHLMATTDLGFMR